MLRFLKNKKTCMNFFILLLRAFIFNELTYFTQRSAEHLNLCSKSKFKLEEVQRNLRNISKLN